MSAYVVGRDHIEAMVLLGLDGPSDHGPIAPGSRPGWMIWYVSDPRAVEYTGHDNAGAYFAGLEAIRHTLTRETAEETARMLTYANVASVKHRYSADADDDLPGASDWSTFADGILRRSPGRMPTAAEGLKLLDCYEYQSCERDDWQGSEAQRFCDALRSRLIHELPGYSDAPWEWSWTRKAA